MNIKHRWGVGPDDTTGVFGNRYHACVVRDGADPVVTSFDEFSELQKFLQEMKSEEATIVVFCGELIRMSAAVDGDRALVRRNGSYAWIDPKCTKSLDFDTPLEPVAYFGEIRNVTLGSKPEELEALEEAELNEEDDWMDVDGVEG